MGKKYINPPLISVKSTVWWHIDSPINFDKSKLVGGLLYDKLKDVYPKFVESIDDPFTTVLSKNDNEEVVVELGNEEVTIVSTDSNYTWEDFNEHIKIIFPELYNELEKLIGLDHYHARLEYLDFFKLEIEEGSDVSAFFREMLKINIDSPLFKNHLHVDLELTQKLEEGFFTINPYVGKRKDDFGVFVKFTLDSYTMEDFPNMIINWFEKAHDICSTSFKEMIEGGIQKTLQYE